MKALAEAPGEVPLAPVGFPRVLMCAHPQALVSRRLMVDALLTLVY